MRKLFASTLLILAAGLAQAEEQRVQVHYVNTEKFADFGRSQWDRERNQQDFKALFEEVAAKLPAGRQLSIKVLDVNLAGELEWVRRATSEIRVLRDVTWPMVEFEYTLSENGRVLKSDTVRLSDMGYLQGGFFTAAQQSTHLRYERRMLDRWYRGTIEGRKR